MVLKLIIEPGQGYHVTDGQAGRWAEAAREAGRVPRLAAEEARAVAWRKLGALECLAEDGRIHRCQLDAGREVRTYWRWWTTRFSAAIARYDGERVGGSLGPDPASVKNLVDRYRAWAASAEARKVKGDLSALQLVLDLCVDDWTPWRMRREYRIGDARALDIVRTSLLDYARMAGWQDVPREAA